MSKILVVDNDPNICESILVFIQDEGFDVYGASDGMEALSKLENIKADMVILDV